MRTGTMVSLGASAVLGLGALVVAKVWLPQSGAHGPAAKPGILSTDTVPVVIASADIPYGGKLDAAHLSVVQMPAAAAPKGAYTTTQQVLNQQGGAPVAITPIAAHEAVLPAKLSGPGARPSVAAAIDEGMRAYTIGVTDVAGVGGHVLPDDRVDVIVTRELPMITVNGQSPCSNNCKRERADVVLQDVKVLGLDLNADPASVQPAVAHTATLEVTVQDAQRLSVASQIGSLSLALRRSGSAEMTPVRPVDIRDVTSQGPQAPGYRPVPDNIELTPVSKPAHRAPAAPSFVRQVEIHTRSVVVVHGDTPASVDVPAERYGAGA